jgi:hypothetical protein
LNDRRTLLVRLSDLPLDLRLRAARDASRNEADPDAKHDLLAAAINPRPEHDLHWVHESAAEMLRTFRDRREAA